MQHNRIAFLLALMTAICNLSVFADDLDKYANKTLQVCKIGSQKDKPEIDGVLDDQLWKMHPSRSDFYQLKPKEYGQATERTEFWLCYDEENLYFAAQAYTSDPKKIIARQHIQGLEMESDDRIHISLDPFRTQRDGYFFQVNPNGMRNDVLLSEASAEFNKEWSTIWYAASKINETGWATEIKIPFSSINFNPKNSQWGFNIGRLVRYNNELVVWNSLGAGIWEIGPVALGTAEPISDIEIGKGVEVIMSTKYAQHRDHINEKTEKDLDPSLDIFYRPKPTVTLAATFNTDFSATEIDDRVVNLSRFDIFIPEKRDFFLQDSNRFSFGELTENGLPFTSRRIGLDENGRPLDIRVGTKATGVAGSTSFGVLAVQQKDAVESDQFNELLVARLTQKITREISLGVIHTQGNPAADLSSSTSGIDAVYNKSKGMNLRTNIWYQKSDTENIEAQDNAYGFGFYIPESRYEFYWSRMKIEKNFNPALGFVNRSDIQEDYIETRYNHYFDSGIIQLYSPDIEWQKISDLSGNLQSEYVQVRPILFDFSQGGYFYAGILDQTEVLNSDFDLLPTVRLLAGRYKFDRKLLGLGSADSRRIFFEYEFEDGDFYSGKNRQQKITLGLRPIDRILMKFMYDESEISLDNSTTLAKLVGYKHEVAITDYWSWLLTVQYDNQSQLAYANSRLRWIPEPGQEFYFIVNKGALRSELNNKFDTIETDIVLKFSYNLRF
jgi:Domain of unknown function (DUF5916)/Carbohydrate family 9 binding domain-like